MGTDIKVTMKNIELTPGPGSYENDPAAARSTTHNFGAKSGWDVALTTKRKDLKLSDDELAIWKEYTNSLERERSYRQLTKANKDKSSKAISTILERVHMWNTGGDRAFPGGNQGPYATTGAKPETNLLIDEGEN